MDAADLVKSVVWYEVDRGKGATHAGIVEVVVLHVRTEDGQHSAFCLSRVDAQLLSQRLASAALDARLII